jgi:hypothetical protein
MYDPNQVECPIRTAHLKEPLCTKSITYGNV